MKHITYMEELMRLIRFRRVLSALFIFFLLFTTQNNISVYGVIDKSTLRERYLNDDSVKLEYTIEMKKYYADYLEEVLSDQTDIARNHSIAPTQLLFSNQNSTKYPGGYEGYEDPAFCWSDKTEWIEYDFESDREALYEIQIDYYLENRGQESSFSVEVNGEVPFSEAYKITLLGGFKDRTEEPLYNSTGDEIAPGQVPVFKWRTTNISDSQGMNDEVLLFKINKGVNKIRFNKIDNEVVLGKVKLVSQEEIPSYSEIKYLYEVNGYSPGSGRIEFQAEKPVFEKTSSTLRGVTNGDLSCEPQSIQFARINAIGDWRWRIGNQAITWEFDVPADGLYNIGVRNLQWWHDGLPVYRKILIDGKVPFEEMKRVGFAYKRSWETDLLAAKDGEIYDFYLKKGKHTITMIVKLGDIGPLVRSLYYDNRIMSDLILKILMVTGSEPDVNYDYQLTSRIPDLVDLLQELYDNLERNSIYVSELALKNPGLANQFRQVMRMLSLMINDPESIPRRMNDLRNSQSSLSSWYLGVQDQPLLVDRFEIIPAGEAVRDTKVSVFRKFYAFFANLYISFVKDYDNVGTSVNGGNEKSIIEVWVGRGKEWAEIIRQLATDSFTKDTGVGLKINVFPATQLNAGAVNALMMAIASGKAPDVALAVSNNSPVEFAIRNGVVDLKQFPEYEEVSQQFLPGVLIPFKYEDGVYALPETMNFKVMIYRKDIMDKLGIKLPQTWEELYSNVLPALYQNNLQFYYSKDDFTPFLFQHGGEFYRDDGKLSGLDSPQAFDAFKEFTELFTHYGVPVVANFYNRFRTGEMPIGIGNYMDYLMLVTAAPELAGRWDIAPIPGRIRNDSVIDRTVGGISGEADIILSATDDKKTSWDFLKWWLSSETQTVFASEIEAIVGVEARWNSANLSAFSASNWKNEDLEVIRDQWTWAKDIPNVLGGYFTPRHINNAWNRVVLGNQDVRSSLEEAVEDINKELRMKQEEYNKDDGE